MKSKQKDLFKIVGVGASAGGLQAFMQFLRRIPSDTGMAFVLVQHLDPKQASSLPGILTKSAKVPVVEVMTTTKIKANHIYTMPSNKDITIVDGTLRPVARKMCIRDRAENRGGLQLEFRRRPRSQLRPAIRLCPVSYTHLDVYKRQIKLIPYYTFDNREPTSMQVWLPYLR